MKTCPTCQKTYPDDFSLCPRDGTHLTTQATETEALIAAGLSRRFRLVRRLGQGGMGTVFLAEQIGVGNRPVALKVLNRKLLDDPDFLLRFQNEAGSTGRIHHPNVVTIYESAQSDDGTPYIAMEFLEGESLREVLKQRGELPVTEVAEILQQAARGLNAAHKLGIIHRDLKPDNLFLTHGDQGERIVKVVDFGIAKLRESTTHTMTGTVLGTPAYMSYEQASGMRSDELDARSDIYSLGVVVYEMLTGRTPFHSDTPVGYLRKHLQDAPPPFRAVLPALTVPPRIESVVMKALAKDRNQRYGLVSEFAEEFAQSAEAGPHLAARPESHREAAKAQTQTIVTPVPRARDHLRKKVRLGLAGLCVLGVLGGGGYYAWTRYVTWSERTRTCREWEGKHPVGSPIDLGVGKLERQFVWDPPRGCPGPLEDAYRKREIAWREEQQKNGVTDYAVQLCSEQGAGTGSRADIFDLVECEKSVYKPLPDNSTAITERYLEGASQEVRDCVAKSTPAGNIATLLEQREHCTENPNNPVVLGFSNAVPIQPGSGQHSPAVETPAPTAPSPIESGTDVTNRRNQVDAAKKQGDNYYENGKYDEAISAYQGGLNLDPSNAQLLQALRRAQTAKAAEEKFNQ
jgi:serine/threonine-protein kinase